MKSQLVIEGLRVKLAEIDSAIRVTEQRLKALARDQATIKTALRIMGSDPAEGAVSLGIATGAFTRTLLAIIRDTGQPVAVRDIADVLAQRVGRPLDKREFNLVVARVKERNAQAWGPT